ncbi:MAG: GNAT family N-acetyltransferase [Promethearchaeota archaeon]
MSETRENFKEKMIRSFFLSFETSSKKEAKTEDIQEEIAKIGLIYIQMKLPVEKITPELEAKLSEKVKQNILRARIREAKKEDLESVMTIYNRAWMTSNTPFSDITKETLEIVYNSPGTVILIARIYGIDGGFIILDFEGANKEYGVISGLGILPRFQRKGLGTVMGITAWRYFKKQGIKELRCEVYVDNKASYNFIKSLGFEEWGTRIYKNESFTL